jgi:hypothetical protein
VAHADLDHLADVGASLTLEGTGRVVYLAGGKALESRADADQRGADGDGARDRIRGPADLAGESGRPVARIAEEKGRDQAYCPTTSKVVHWVDWALPESLIRVREDLAVEVRRDRPAIFSGIVDSRRIDAQPAGRIY